MRDAESTLDQLISFCGDKIEEADVLSMFGLAAQSQILKLSTGGAGRRNPDGADAIERTGARRQGPGPAAGRFAESFPQPADFPDFAGRPESVGSFRSRSCRAQGAIGAGEHRTLDAHPGSACRGGMRLRDAASKKILVEVALLKAIEARNAVSLDAVLKQLNQLRGGWSDFAGRGSCTGDVPASVATNPRQYVTAPNSSRLAHQRKCSTHASRPLHEMRSAWI